ncbi:hypothetical protein GOV13_00255 [Candidatus Pacearchaeota archaeon]|nr:hypothetical protein [Candidatus Pacearchaeota archaeon]
MTWSDEDISYLKKNYSTNPNMDEMCERLNRSRRAIQHKGARLGLSRHGHLSRVYPGRTPRKIIEKRYYEKNKERIYRRKINRMRELKKEMVKMLGGKCQKCGYNNKCFAVFDFHHQKGDKEGNVSLLLKNESRQKLLKEIKKCILLCANCHRELHHTGQ